MKNTVYTTIRRAVPGLAIALALTLVPHPPQAHATAAGRAQWGGIVISLGAKGGSTSVRIPVGELYGLVRGKGQNVDMVYAQWSAKYVGICNWHVAFRFYDRSGKEYKTVNGRDHGSCSAAGVSWWNPSGDYRAQPGRVCIGLYTHFTKELAKVCHAILPSAAPAPPKPAPPRKSSCAYAWPRNLAAGSRGPDVRELQRRLNLTGANLVTDSAFGPKTKQAVIRFQKASHLEPDGIVGPKTQAALNKRAC